MGQGKECAHKAGLVSTWLRARQLGRDQRSMEANDAPCGIVPEM